MPALPELTDFIPMCSHPPSTQWQAVNSPSAAKNSRCKLLRVEKTGLASGGTSRKAGAEVELGAKKSVLNGNTCGR